MDHLDYLSCFDNYLGWECEYNELMKHGHMKEYYERYCRPLPPITSRTLTGHELLDQIRLGHFFGLVEVYSVLVDQFNH